MRFLCFRSEGRPSSAHLVRPPSSDRRPASEGRPPSGAAVASHWRQFAPSQPTMTSRPVLPSSRHSQTAPALADERSGGGMFGGRAKNKKTTERLLAGSHAPDIRNSWRPPRKPYFWGDNLAWLDWFSDWVQIFPTFFKTDFFLSFYMKVDSAATVVCVIRVFRKKNENWEVFCVFSCC